MKAVLLVILSACLSGCMTFNGAELPRRDLPDHDWFKPVISTEVGEVKLLHNGKEGLKPPMSATGIGNRALSAVLSRWKAAKLVQDYDPPGKLDGEPDYRLRISGTQNEQSSFAAAFVTGLTLFLFPSSATLQWDWVFHLTNAKTNQRFEVATRNSVTQWMHLIFLPVFPFSVVGQFNADSALSHYVYDEFKKQGAWRHGQDQASGSDSNP
jgi:hypothetical protein